MFFSFRKDSEDEDDEPPKVNKQTLRTVANKVATQQQITGKAGNEDKVLSPKRGSVGLLSVVAAITQLESTKETVLNSDELVKKLFKGLGISLYKPVVQSEYQNSTIPPVIADYRWGAFDLPVYHDTMLSIVRPVTPPPPPATIPTTDTTIESSTIQQPIEPEEEQSPANSTPRNMETEKPSSEKAAVVQQSQKSFKRPPRKKSHSSKSQEDNHILAEEQIEGSEQAAPRRRRSRADSASFGKADQPSPRSADASRSRRQSFEGPGGDNTRASGERMDLAGGGIDILEQMKAMNLQDNLTQQPSSSSMRRRRQRSGGSAHNPDTSRSQSKEEEGAGVDDSIEALLRLDSAGSQRRFLKHTNSTSAAAVAESQGIAARMEGVAAPTTGDAPDTAAAVADAIDISLQSAESHEVPSSVPQELPAQDTKPDTPPHGEAGAVASEGMRTTSKHEGKIISPVERSVFRPSFAQPRPQPLSPPSAAVATAGNSHSASDRESSILQDASPPYRINSVNYQNIAASTPALHSGYAEKRSISATEAQSNSEQDIDFKKFRRPAGSGSEGTRPTKPKKHASPSKHWYMAGAYSSHSEAIEAIAHLHKLVSATSPSGAIDTNEMLNEKFRLQRDLGRMQWVVECSDAHSKSVVQAYTAGRQQQQQLDMLGVDEHSRYPHPAPAVREGKPRRKEKYLRERDQALEHNMRAIRQQLPEQEEASRLRFPPLPQAQALQSKRNHNSKPKSSQPNNHRGRRKG